MDERAASCLQIAHDALVLAISLAPNWRGSRFTVEDLQRMEAMRGDLAMLTRAAPPDRR